ncbi:hypothetical protein JCM10908_005238 [Rhodotorula pacifica]|uniref:uncharacterized protein n=1 Tax=Rhodotorula pacifica TaxID=1495444 RepID=UPI0031790A72
MPASTESKLALIDKLPAEILLAVFSLTGQAHDDEQPCYDDASIYQHFRRRRNPVVAISHVCQAWRALAQATPSLWSTLYLDGEIDGERAEVKAMWWTRRALPQAAAGEDGPAITGAVHSQREAVEGDYGATIRREKADVPGVVSVVMTRVQDWTPDDFAGLCEALELLHLGSLERVRFSWMGGGLSTDENRQLQAAFRFLVPSARTLRSLTVYSPSHLRIGFSLPRLGHTFSALEDVEIRSCKLALPASDAYLLPTFLPRYAGDLPDPDLALGLANLRTLRLLRSGPLATRVLACALRERASLRFTHLETVELAGAQVQQAHLDLFATTRAPVLRRLDLSDTTVAGSPTFPQRGLPIQLQLPAIATLEELVLMRVEWITAAAIVGAVETSRLPRLNQLITDLEVEDLDRWKLEYRGISVGEDGGEAA